MEWNSSEVPVQPTKENASIGLHCTWTDLPEDRTWNQVNVVPLHLIPKSSSYEAFALVYFDVETSGFYQGAEVIQIAAVYEETNYEAFIQPKFIQSRVTELTGLKIDKEKNGLMRGDEVLETVPAEHAWGGLMNFLYSIKKRIVLVGHAIHFDLRAMENEVPNFGLENHMKELIFGFVNTLKVFKQAFPGRSSYKQKDIADYLSINIGKAHDAMVDARTLEAICEKIPLNVDVLDNYLEVFSDYLWKRQQTKAQKNRDRESLAVLNLPAITVGKMLRAGLSLDKCTVKFKEEGEEGVKSMLQKCLPKNVEVVVVVVDHLKGTINTELKIPTVNPNLLPLVGGLN